MEILSTTLKKVEVVSRNDIRSINSVIVDGIEHTLGEQRDFRRDSILKNFMPEHGRYSFSWVKLKDGETLDNHDHPTQSMIIVCKGSVELTGDCQKQLNEGDIVCVPPTCVHGFRTRAGETFEGLSVQFEGEGLYENEDKPRVGFVEENIGFAALNALSDHRLEQHGRNSLFELVRSNYLQDNPEAKERFIAALYIFSRYFQRMVLARQAVCTNEELYPLYWDHLSEEFGHDQILFTQNNITLKLYDPILEAASNWFVMKMFDSDEAEKIVIIHLVVEASGHLFGMSTKDIFKREDKKESFFELHAEADDDHRNIGMDYLKSLSNKKLDSLKEICNKAWDQIDLVHERIVALTLNHK